MSPIQTLRIITVLCGLCCQLFSLNVLSNTSPLTPPIVLENDFTAIHSLPWVRYFEDTHGTKDTQHIFSLDQNLWQTSTDTPLNFGFSNSTFWFNFSLENQSQALQELYIHLDYALLDDIRVYHVIGNKLVQKYESGDHLPFGERPVDFPTFLFPISLDTNTDSEVYIRIASQGTVQAPISVWDKDFFLLDSHSFLFLYGCFLSAMLIMSAYNFCLFLTIRDKNYFLYSLFILLPTGAHSSLDGFAYHGFWPALPE